MTAYESVYVEWRDFLFYAEDLLHRSLQAVVYIWERFAEAYFGEDTQKFLEEWRPIKEALGHRPFNPDSQEYKDFLAATLRKAELLAEKYSDMEWKSPAGGM